MVAISAARIVLLGFLSTRGEEQHHNTTQKLLVRGKKTMASGVRALRIDVVVRHDDEQCDEEEKWVTVIKHSHLVELEINDDNGREGVGGEGEGVERAGGRR